VSVSRARVERPLLHRGGSASMETGTASFLSPDSPKGFGSSREDGEVVLNCACPTLLPSPPPRGFGTPTGWRGWPQLREHSHPPALDAPRRVLAPASTFLSCAFCEQRGWPLHPIIRTLSSKPPDTPLQSFPNPSETDPYPSTPSSSDPKTGRCPAKSHRPGPACHCVFRTPA
jgi:hypothetical protein